jgi:hypothetical protein
MWCFYNTYIIDIIRQCYPSSIRRTTGSVKLAVLPGDNDPESESYMWARIDAIFRTRPGPPVFHQRGQGKFCIQQATRVKIQSQS